METKDPFEQMIDTLDQYADELLTDKKAPGLEQKASTALDTIFNLLNVI